MRNNYIVEFEIESVKVGRRKRKTIACSLCDCVIATVKYRCSNKRILEIMDIHTHEHGLIREY